MISFEDLGLSKSILNAVKESGYDTPTPIQAATIPIALEGRDVTGTAQTGTGKTAAFTLPMLERLSRSRQQGNGSNRKPRRVVRGLVITPTRELANQVEQSVRRYGRKSGLTSTSIYGGVGMAPQIQALRRGVDIIIATPGRLLDHISSGRIDLSRVETLVLDEADRMFDMGFIKDIRKIVKELPNDRQTLLFSATMPPAIQSLCTSIQRTPERVEIGDRRNPAKSVRQTVYGVAQQGKMDLLMSLISSQQPDSMLVFTRTKHRADKVKRQLEKKKISAVAIHSNRSQAQRQRALDGFRSGQFRVMVATDVAARGLDVDGITHVINFDIPGTPDDYIHRIGRTGRAESSGDAITFIAPEDRNGLRTIERKTGARIERRNLEADSGPVENRRASSDRPKRGESQAHGKRVQNESGGKSSRPRRSRKSGKPVGGGKGVRRSSGQRKTFTAGR